MANKQILQPICAQPSIERHLYVALDHNEWRTRFDFHVPDPSPISTPWYCCSTAQTPDIEQPEFYDEVDLPDNFLSGTSSSSTFPVPMCSFCGDDGCRQCVDLDEEDDILNNNLDNICDYENRHYQRAISAMSYPPMYLHGEIMLAQDCNFEEAHRIICDRLIGIEMNPGPLSQENNKRNLSDRNSTAGGRKMKTSSARQQNLLDEAIALAHDKATVLPQENETIKLIPLDAHLNESCLTNVYSLKTIEVVKVGLIASFIGFLVNILNLLKKILTLGFGSDVSNPMSANLPIRYWHLSKNMDVTEKSSLRNIESTSGKTCQASTIVHGDLTFHNGLTFVRRNICLNQDIVLALFAHFRFMPLNVADMMKYSQLLERTLLTDKTQNFDREFTCYYCIDLINSAQAFQKQLGF